MSVLDRFVACEFLRCRWLSFPLRKRRKAGDSRRPRPTNCGVFMEIRSVAL